MGDETNRTHTRVGDHVLYNCMYTKTRGIDLTFFLVEHQCIEYYCLSQFNNQEDNID